MKSFKKGIFYIRNIVILAIFVINWYSISYINREYSHLDKSQLDFFAFCILIVSTVLVMFYVKKLYEDPIKDLEYHIKSFLVWKTKNKNLKLIKTINPHLNYVLLFFWKTINTLKSIKEEFVSGKAIKWEVDLAKEIQWKLLNKKLQKIPSLEIIAKSKPAWEIGWDSYDIIKQEDNYYIYVWDATGHWVAAWFVMSMVNALTSWFSKLFKSWAEILAHTNEILKPRIKSNILMTVLMVRWNEKEKRLFMTWAWHEYLMIYKRANKKCFKVKSGGIALWMTRNIHKILKEQEITFEKDDIIVLYSDWITEAINQSKKDWNQQMFWESRLVKAIENSPEINENWNKIKTARCVFNNITIELSKFMWYKHAQLDDVTLVVAHYKWETIVENDLDEKIWKDFLAEWDWD